MKTAIQNTEQGPAIETAPIRLTMDETKLLIRAANAGKPIKLDYQAPGNELADLGVLRRVEVSEEKDTALKVAECWARAKKALAVKDSETVHQAMRDLERLNSDRDRNNTKYLFELTDLGKQIARGITVRMNGRYRKR